MKDPLVLLPGMMCDARLFEHQIRELSRDRAVTLAPVTGGDRVEEIASGLLDHLPMRFALVGLSMGGVVAMELLRRAPDRITRLCLMDTHPLPETPEVAAAREPLIMRARAGRLGEVLRDWMRPDFLAPGVGRADILNRVVAMGMAHGPAVFERQSRAMQRRPDQQSALRRCKLPVLVVCGEHDGLTPVRRHQFLADLIPGARLHVVAGAGHLPSMEQPEAVTALLHHWSG